MRHYLISLAFTSALVPADAAWLRSRTTDKQRRNRSRHDVDLSSRPPHSEQSAFDTVAGSRSASGRSKRQCPHCGHHGDGGNRGLGDINPGKYGGNSPVTLSTLPWPVSSPPDIPTISSASFTLTSTPSLTSTSITASTYTSSPQSTSIGSASSTSMSPRPTLPLSPTSIGSVTSINTILSSSTSANSPVSTVIAEDGPTSQKYYRTETEISRERLAGGLTGGFLAVLFLCAAWYWFVFRRKRRQRRERQNAAAQPKDADLENHDTGGSRTGSYTPYSGPYDDRNASTDGLTHATVPLTAPGPGPIVVGSAACSPAVSRPVSAVHVEPYMTIHRPSPAASQAFFVDGYATPRIVHNPDHSRPASPQRSIQGSTTATSRPPSRPSPLQTGSSHLVSIPNPIPTIIRPDNGPPSRYPDTMTPSPENSPTSPRTVSPLSATSSHAYSLNTQTHTAAGTSAPYHTQTHQSQAPRQSSYKDHEPSAFPQVVSPIYQLGQTSASPPEYSESAEMAMHNDYERAHPDLNNNKQ